MALLVMVALFAGTVIYFSDEPETPVDTALAGNASGYAEQTAGPGQGSEAPSELIGKARVPVPDGLPASLEGTNLPGGWGETDSNGSLVPTPQLVARIEQALARLEEPARSEAMTTLGNYLDYKLALGDLEVTYGNATSLDVNEMQQRMAEIRALRRIWMDAQTADAFFASDEAVDQFQVEQLRIRGDESLSDGEREQALERAEHALPAPIREARRVERFGKEAARQLEKVEAEQRAWDNKWQSYSEALRELDDLGLAGPEREAAVDSLRDDYFEGAEKLRAEALDSIR